MSRAAPEVQAASERVRERLVELLAVERGIAASVQRWRTVVTDRDVQAAMDQLGTDARSHLTELERRLDALGGREESGGADSHLPAPSVTGSTALRQVAALAFDAALADEAAYQVARLAYDAETCDLLDAHLSAHAAFVGDARRLLPHLVARELRDAGLTCTCQCPMCSLGACGCVRATLVTTETGWGGEYPREAGLLLLIPPRPGSQLADAGCQQGDRIATVDGEGVGSNQEMQAGLRRHEIGEAVSLSIERRTGERTELRVTRIA